MFCSINTHAYDVGFRQWKTLNMSDPYINEYMICYLINDTVIIWDTYQNGISNWTTPDDSFTYDIYCCDNCYIQNDEVHFSPNSLNYNVDNDLNISTNLFLDYYVGDILDRYRTISTTINNSEAYNIDGWKFWAGMILLIMTTIASPLLFSGFFELADPTKMVVIGGSIGFFIGIGLCAVFNLFNLMQSFLVFIFGLFVMIMFVGVGRSG